MSQAVQPSRKLSGPGLHPASRVPVHKAGESGSKHSPNCPSAVRLVAVPDPFNVGERVLAALARGRRLWAEEEARRVAELEREIRRELDLDLLKGHPPLSRAGRIAKCLKMPRRTVAKYLARLSGRANSLVQDDDGIETGERN